MINNLFTYGTLMFPEVIPKLTDKRFRFTDLSIPGFRRVPLKGQDFPGLVEDDTSSVAGRLYFDIDRQSLDIIDQFEADFYVRRLISVSADDNTNAYLYLLDDFEKIDQSKLDWDPDYFRTTHLNNYLRMCEEFRSSLSH